MKNTNSLLQWARARKERFRLSEDDMAILLEWNTLCVQMPFLYEDEIMMPHDYICSENLMHAIWWWLQDGETARNVIGCHVSDNNNFIAQSIP